MSVPGSLLWHAGIQSCPPSFAFQAAPEAEPPSLPEGNLLLWTEQMDNAAWTKTGITITADAAANPNPPGDGSSTADQASWSSFNRRLEQITTTATSGSTASTAISPVPGAWTRFSVTNATLSAGTSTLSVYVQGVSGAGTLSLRLGETGGFVHAYLLSVGGSLVANVWGWQLEAGASATDYIPRTT